MFEANCSRQMGQHKKKVRETNAAGETHSGSDLLLYPSNLIHNVLHRKVEVREHLGGIIQGKRFHVAKERAKQV